MEQNRFFPQIKGNFGFGCMRLPQREKEVNYDEFSRMADSFIAAGFNYFDTAHGYHGGLSETAIRDCVVRRHDRKDFLLTDKLTAPYFQTQKDIRPFFESQLEACGTDYFDFYLMHAQDRNNYRKFVRCKAYETAFALKEEGLVRHVGLSFHDKAEVLDMILSEHPEVEVIQIQLNYLDFEDSTVESRKVYEVCVKHGKPVIVMEPVKGGSLVRLPEEADRILRETGEGSNASYALRFASGFPNVAMVLSGMSNMQQMDDNLKTMCNFRPLNEKEMNALGRVCGIFRGKNTVACTGCRYCVEENSCPRGIDIPAMFSALNAYGFFSNWNTEYYYKNVITGPDRAKASQCIKCGKCEKVCPQHLPIRSLLEQVAQTFEK